MIYPHALILFPSVEQSDPDGNPIRRPGPSGIAARGYLQPRTSAEDGSTGQKATAHAVVYLAASAPFLDAFSEVELAGRRWQLRGEATSHTDVAGARIYWRAELRAVS